MTTRRVSAAVFLFFPAVVFASDSCDPETLFGASLPFSAGSLSQAIAIEDFNGDGISDLALATNETSEGVSVVLGNGDGTFGEQTLYRAGIGPVFVTVGDFTGDSVPDLAVANTGNPFAQIPGYVSLFIGNGDGTFQDEQQLDAGDGPSAIALADFDSNGMTDLAVANQFSDEIIILIGAGGGAFPTESQIPLLDAPFSLAVGDLDGDGTLDLVSGNLNSDNIGVLLGVGDGTFQSPQFYAIGDAPQEIAIGHLNGDGFLDIAAANAISDDTSILLGNGDGTFKDGFSVDSGNSSNSVAIGDLNGDGVNDLAVAVINELASPSAHISVLLGHGDGTFATRVLFDVGTPARDALVGFLNNDQSLDIAAIGGGPQRLRILLNECGVAVCPGDCNEDGAVNFGDLVAMLFEFGNQEAGIGCDLDGGGNVDFGDLVGALFLFGPCS